tara:strand:+ start:1860 stop:3200 length:1341 start_codon:yes stop_codon:yes gene_type:complete
MSGLPKNVLELIGKHRGLSVHKGNIRVQFKVPDRVSPVRKSLGYPATETNVALAVSTLANIKNDIANRLYEVDNEMFWDKHFPLRSDRAPSKITVEECFLAYREKKKSTISVSMRNKLTTALNWLKFYGYGKKLLIELDRKTLEGLRSKTVTGNKEGKYIESKFKGCSVATVNDYSLVVGRVLAFAVREEFIKHNPMKEVERLSEDEMGSRRFRIMTGSPMNESELEDEDLNVHPFSKAELDKLLDTVHLPKTKLMIRFLAWTGLRHGELKALAWEDIDLKNRKLLVRYNLTRDGTLKPPKTKNGRRIVKLLPEAISVLEEIKELSAYLPARQDKIFYKNNKTEVIMRRRVFLSRGNLPFKRPELTTVNGQWERWLVKAGLRHRPAYQLRHTYASQLLMAGTSALWLAKQMGHGDTSMIHKIYGKWIEEEQPEFMDELAKSLGQSY